MNYFSRIIACLLFSLIIAGCGGGESTDIASGSDSLFEQEELLYTSIDVMQARQLISENPDLVIVDVTEWYEDDYVPTDASFYAYDGSFDEAIPGLDPFAPYLIYSNDDDEAASLLGMAKMLEAGFTNIYWLDGNPTDLFN